MKVVTSHIVVGLVIGACVLWAPMVKANEQEKSRLLEQVNRERAIAGCPPLRENDILSAAAQAQAEDMPKKKYFGHVSPEGSTPDRRARERGYAYVKLAENVAAGQETPDEVVLGWMNSPAHRKAMLDCAYTEVGMGHRYEENDQPFQKDKAPYYDYWAQVYAEPKEDTPRSTPKSRRKMRNEAVLPP